MAIGCIGEIVAGMKEAVTPQADVKKKQKTKNKKKHNFFFGN